MIDISKDTDTERADTMDDDTMKDVAEQINVIRDCLRYSM
jgi:hypothetical protein